MGHICLTLELLFMIFILILYVYWLTKTYVGVELMKVLLDSKNRKRAAIGPVLTICTYYLPNI